MTHYVAFLRGINVGGRVIKMADLKQCLEKAGLHNVTTLLQSGNAMFDSEIDDPATMRQALETAVSRAFAYEAIIFVYPSSLLAKIVAEYPFAKPEGEYHRYVILLGGASDDLVKEIISHADPAIEKVAEGPSCIYWLVPRGRSLDSPLAKSLTKSKIKPFVTVRNLNTLEKMVS